MLHNTSNFTVYLKSIL